MVVASTYLSSQTTRRTKPSIAGRPDAILMPGDTADGGNGYSTSTAGDDNESR